MGPRGRSVGHCVPMPDRLLPAGKLSVELLAELIGAGPAPPADVLCGPGIGEDACVLAVDGKVLVAATDPITLTGAAVGGMAVVINANDVAVTGVRPRWFLATVLLPAESREGDVRDVFAGMRRALAGVGASLVGGHTEVTPAVTQPVVVGQMLGVSETGRFVTTAGVRPGDVIVQVGKAPVEGAAVLAEEFSARLGGVDPVVVRAAADALTEPGISVVEAALAATELGATALHDPTEGGLWSGLHEMARAAGVALRVDTARIAWFEPGVVLCRALGADPGAMLASGALLCSFPAGEVETAIRMLAARDHPVAVIGVAAAGRGVTDTEGRSVPWPERDEVARLRSAGNS